MSSSMKNIVVILLALTFAYAAYYFYIQNNNTSLDIDSGTVTDEILANTQLFIQHRATLESVQMNTAIFENEVFLSYRSFSQPLLDEPYGRQNPFAVTAGSARSD
jgi:hypothetical protein